MLKIFIMSFLYLNVLFANETSLIKSEVNSEIDKQILKKNFDLFIRYNNTQVSETEILHLYEKSIESLSWVKEQTIVRKTLIVLLYKSLFDKFSLDMIENIQKKQDKNIKFYPLGIYAKNLFIMNYFLKHYTNDTMLNDYLKDEMQLSFEFLSGFITEVQYQKRLQELNSVPFNLLKKYSDKDITYTKNIFYQQFLDSLEYFYQLLIYSSIQISKEDIKLIINGEKR